MSIIVLGAGSIGCFLGGLIASRGEPVTLLGRPAVLEPIKRQGLVVQPLGKDKIIVPFDAFDTTEDPARLSDFETILVTVKGIATEGAAETIRQYCRPDATIVSFQNGVRNPHKLRSWVPNTVLAGMVPFNVVQPMPGHFEQMTAGHLYLQDGTPSGGALASVFNQAGVTTELRSDMARVLWSKLVLNLNNAVNALSGIPLQAMLLDADYRWVLSRAQEEALRLMTASGFTTCRIGRLIPRTLPYALRLPTPLFRVVAKNALDIDPHASSSMQDDLRSGKLTEIDLLNGEIVRLAEKLKTSAPVNATLQSLVHQAETEAQNYRTYSGKSLRQVIQHALSSR